MPDVAPCQRSEVDGIGEFVEALRWLVQGGPGSAEFSGLVRVWYPAMGRLVLIDTVELVQERDPWTL